MWTRWTRPVEKGTVYGKVELYINLDEKIGEVELVAAESVEASEVLVLWETCAASSPLPGSSAGWRC